MNKVVFINELKSKLNKLPKDELENALSYYNEYFEDAGIDENIEQELGMPSTIASQILADYAIKEKPNKSKISSIWFIILAIFASPIALPLAFAGVITIFALVFAMIVVLFSLLIATVSIAFAGGAVFLSGISILFTQFSASILLMGLGSVLCGIGLLVSLGLILILNGGLKSIVKVSNKILFKLNKKELR